jgi:hypothetical protein
MPPVEAMGPEEEILRIGEIWQARTLDRGLRSEPSPISVFTSTTTSTVRLERRSGSAVEELIVQEQFKLRNGATYNCQSGARIEVRVSYGRRAGEPTVTLSRPPVYLNRECDAPGFPEPNVTVAEGPATFALRGDQLEAIDPPLEKRTFLPTQ